MRVFDQYVLVASTFERCFLGSFLSFCLVFLALCLASGLKCFMSSLFLFLKTLVTLLENAKEMRKKYNGDHV